MVKIVELVTAGMAFLAPLSAVSVLACPFERPEQSLQPQLPQPLESAVDTTPAGAAPGNLEVDGRSTQQTPVKATAEIQQTPVGAAETTNAGGSNSRLLVRDPFTGRMVPAAATPRGDGTATTPSNVKNDSGASSSKKSVEDSEDSQSNMGTPSRSQIRKSEPAKAATDAKTGRKSKPWSVLPKGDGSGGGGAVGGLPGIGSSASGGARAETGGGTSGSDGGTGGTNNGLSLSPDAGGPGVAAAGGGKPKTGVLSTGEGTESQAKTAREASNTRPPEPTIPDPTPDVPREPFGHGGPTQPTSQYQCEAPVVPEPGSLVLLGIAGGVGGLRLIRRRHQKRLGGA